MLILGGEIYVTYGDVDKALVILDWMIVHVKDLPIVIKRAIHHSALTIAEVHRELAGRIPVFSGPLPLPDRETAEFDCKEWLGDAVQKKLQSYYIANAFQREGSSTFWHVRVRFNSLLILVMS